MWYFILLKHFRYYSVMHLPGLIDIDKMDLEVMISFLETAKSYLDRG